MFYRLVLTAVALASLTACEAMRPYAASPAPVVSVTSAAPAAVNKAAPSNATEAQPASMITPMMDKRETYVATGYAVISVQNHKNPAQQRLLAIRASKRSSALMGSACAVRTLAKARPNKKGAKRSEANMVRQCPDQRVVREAIWVRYNMRRSCTELRSKDKVVS